MKFTTINTPQGCTFKVQNPELTPKKRGNGLLIFVFLLVLSTGLFDAMTVSNIEQMKREQARDNLQNIKHCLKHTMNKINLTDSFDICIAKSKTSFTGDAYVLELDSLEFVYDPSKDVPLKSPYYFTKESVGEHFVDWDSAVVAKAKMFLGKDSREGVNAFYYFNENPEWLEWIHLPDEFGSQYLIVQGIQKVEVMQRYSRSRYCWFSLIFVICIGLITIDSRRKADDRDRDTRCPCPLQQ